MNVYAEFSNNPLIIQVEENDTATVQTNQQIARGYRDNPSIPTGGNSGDLLAKRSSGDYDTEWITPASHAEADNTRPITAAAVYTEIGNINALLSVI